MKFYIIQGAEQDIALELFVHLAGVLAAETGVTSAEAKHQLRHSYGIIEISDGEKAKRVSEGFQKLGLDNFILRENELVTFPPVKLLDKNLQEVDKDVGLVTAGIVRRETTRKEFGLGGIAKAHTIDITMRREARIATYVDIFTEDNHFRINLRPTFYSAFQLWLKDISENIPDVYLGRSVRKILEGKQDLVTRFSDDKYYDKYLRWLVQLRFAEDVYFCPAEAPNGAAEEILRGETRSPIPDASERGEDFSKPHMAAGVKEDKIIGNHKILEEIGKSDLGIVYRAEQISLSRIVAMKVLPEHLAGNPSFVNRFLNEARTMAALNHSNIVRTYNIGQEGQTYYYTMEFVEGTSLSKIMLQGGALPLHRAIKIVVVVAKALAYSHERGIVHGNIKPSNIIIDRFARVKLTDFGLAFQEGAGSVATEVDTVGAAEYMSPEQLSGENATAVSDIYSLGVVFYRLLTGTVPFEASTPQKIVKKIQKEEPAPPRWINPEISPLLEKVVLKMIAKNAERRYPDFRKVLADLRRFSTQGSV